MDYYTGDIFFDTDKDYEYQKPIIEASRKLHVTCCPLCGSDCYTVVGMILFKSLTDKWIKKTGFNPIPDIYKDDILEKRVCSYCGLCFYNYELQDGDWLYDRLGKSINYYPNFQWEHGVASSMILELKPKNVLEIGGGYGAFAQRIRNLVPKVTVSEYNKHAIQILKEKNINVIANNLDVIDEKFDCICCFETLEHIQDTNGFMQNMIRLLDSKGTIMFGTPNPDGILRINGVGPLNLPPHHQFDFSKKTFEFIAKKYGLSIIRYLESDLDYHQYERYVQNITNKELVLPDMQGFFEAQKRYKGHFHFVAMTNNK